MRGAFDVGADRRLVEQEQRGRVQECDRRVHPAPLATRQAMHRAVEQVRQPQPDRERVDPFGPGATAQPAQGRERAQVLAGGQHLEQADLLRRDADGAGRELRGPTDVAPAHVHAARVGPQQPGDDRDERRLARAVRADQPHDLARFDGQRHAPQRGLGAVALLDLDRLEHPGPGATRYGHVAKIRSRILMSSSYLGVRVVSTPRDTGGVADTERWTPERRRQRTRDALLDAAVTVFAKRGFHGASLDEIAETAGYTRGAIYKHFADKEEMLHAACARLNDQVIAEFAAMPGADVPLQRYEAADIEAIGEQWREVMEVDADFTAVMLEYQLYALRNPEARERARVFRHANQQRIADYIRSLAERSGERVSVPIDDLAAIFGTASDAFSQLRLVDDDAVRLFGLFLTVFVRGLRALTDDEDAGRTE